MANPWFHIPSIPDADGVVTIEGEEARHALRARRLLRGDGVCLFDGVGAIAEATVEEAGAKGRSFDARIQAVRQVARPSPSLHIAAALPKGDRQATMLSMVTQLGATSFTPLITDHGVASPGTGFATRAERIVLQTCKQARRPHLLEVHGAMAVGDVVARLAGTASPVLLADPAGTPLPLLLKTWKPAPDVWVLVGPEGGFTDAEIAAATSGGAALVSLGPYVLRIETAVVALAAALMSEGIAEG